MKSVLAFLFAAVACLTPLAGSPAGKPIVGKWKNKEGRFEFTSDGKLLMRAGKVSASGTYTLPDDGHFTADITLGDDEKHETVAYTVKGDTLTTDDAGKIETFKRVR